MATIYSIKLSNTDIALSGKNLKVEKEKYLSEYKIKNPSKQITEEEIVLLKENVLSKNEAEKIILKTLLQVYANENKKLETFNMILDLSQQIQDATISVQITGDEVKWFSAAFEKIPEKIPGQWTLCPELFKQLVNPKEVKLVVKEEIEKEEVKE